RGNRGAMLGGMPGSMPPGGMPPGGPGAMPPGAPGGARGPGGGQAPVLLQQPGAGPGGGHAGPPGMPGGAGMSGMPGGASGGGADNNPNATLVYITRDKANVKVRYNVALDDTPTVGKLIAKAVEASGLSAINDGLFEGTLSSMNTAFNAWSAAKPDQL